MRRSGIDQVFDDEKRTKLEDSYQRYGNKVLGEAAMGMSGDLILLDTNIKMGRISAMDAAKEKARINGVLKARTGVDVDLFDFKDIQSTAGSVTTALIASAQRAEARRWEVEDRDAAIAARREDEAREEAIKAAQISAIWAAGTVEEGIAAGLDRADFDRMAIIDYQAGNFDRIANAYARNRSVSDRAATIMQAKVTASLGQEYTKGTEAAYKEWSTLYAKRPAAAAAYYGKYHTAFQAFDFMRRGGLSDNQAYIRSFGDPIQLNASF